MSQVRQHACQTLGNEREKIKDYKVELGMSNQRYCYENYFMYFLDEYIVYFMFSFSYYRHID